MKHYTPVQLKALIDAASTYGRNPELYKALVCVMVDYGLRVGEAVNLKVSDFLPDDTVQITRQKSGITHYLPLRNRSREALQEYSSVCNSSEYLFSATKRGHISKSHDKGYCKSALQKVFSRIAKKAKKLLKDPTMPTNIHALRHTCAMELCNAGASGPQVQAWLGHRHISSTDVYMSVATGNLREMVKGVDGHDK